MKTNYKIERYRKDVDQPEAVTDVSAVDGETLAAIFNSPLDEFVYVYRIEARHAVALEPITGITFDLERFEYFLDITAD